MNAGALAQFRGPLVAGAGGWGAGGEAGVLEAAGGAGGAEEVVELPGAGAG
jgi:hypothetical protein